MDSIKLLTEGGEQCSADQFTAGPWDHGEDEHESETEEDERGFVLFSIRVSFLDFGAANVNECDGDDAQQGVLNGKETEHFVAHCGAHIAKSGFGERAGEHKHQADQQLNVQEDHEKEAGLGIACAVRLLSGNAHNGADHCDYAKGEDEPAHVRVNV